MYAWFRDSDIAEQYAQYVEDLVRRAPWDQIEAMATAHALALGGVILFHPQQRTDAGYAVPVPGWEPRITVYRAKPWWQRLVWYAAAILVGALAWWVVGLILGFVEVMPW